MRSFSFDQPDDAASWRWYRGHVRSTHDMLSDVDAALNLLDEVIESEAADAGTPDSELSHSQFADAGLPGQTGLSSGNGSVLSEVNYLVEVEPDLGNFGEPLWVTPASVLLQQVALLQGAVSVAIVTSQYQQLASTLESSNSSHAEFGHAESSQGEGTPGKAVESSALKDIHMTSGDVSDFRCCQCHPSEQQYGLWLKVAERAGRSSFDLAPDCKTDNTKKRPTQDHDLLFPVSLGIETNTVYVAFDGQKFVKVARPGGDPLRDAAAAEHSFGNSAGSGNAVESDADQRVSETEKTPLMRRRNESMWGPRWTVEAEAEKNGLRPKETKSSGPSPEVYADNEASRQAADQRRALLGSGAVRSRRRKTEAKSRCLRYNATQETCRATPLSSRNSAGCRDRRSCKVRDHRGDQ